MSSSPCLQADAVARVASELESLVRVVANSTAAWKEQQKILSGAGSSTRAYCRAVLISLLSRCIPLGDAQIALINEHFNIGQGRIEPGNQSWIPSEHIQKDASETVGAVPKFFKLLASHDLNHGTRLASDAVNLLHRLVNHVILQGQDASSSASAQASTIVSLLTQYLDARKVRWQIGRASEDKPVSAQAPESVEPLSLLNILAMVVGLVDKTRWRGIYANEDEKNVDVVSYGKLLLCFLIASDQRLSEQEAQLLRTFWREATVRPSAASRYMIWLLRLKMKP